MLTAFLLRVTCEDQYRLNEQPDSLVKHKVLKQSETASLAPSKSNRVYQSASLKASTKQHVISCLFEGTRMKCKNNNMPFYEIPNLFGS